MASWMRIVAAVVPLSVLALVSVLAAPTAKAHGCSHYDHVWGDPPIFSHEFYNEWTQMNAHFHRWWEVGAGSAGYNVDFCGCVNPHEPCAFGPQQQ